MFRVANSYFDALEGDSGKIGAFADDCVRHENGYRTVNNPPPGGGQIRHVEAFPFVTLPYGLGNGWTPGSGR